MYELWDRPNRVSVSSLTVEKLVPTCRFCGWSSKKVVVRARRDDFLDRQGLALVEMTNGTGKDSHQAEDFNHRIVPGAGMVSKRFN